MQWVYLTVFDWDHEQNRIKGKLFDSSCIQKHIIIFYVTNLKLYAAILDNTGNNNMTCKTIQDVHKHQGFEWNSDEQQLLYVHLFST